MNKLFIVLFCICIVGCSDPGSNVGQITQSPSPTEPTNTPSVGLSPKIKADIMVEGVTRTLAHVRTEKANSEDSQDEKDWVLLCEVYDDLHLIGGQVKACNSGNYPGGVSGIYIVDKEFDYYILFFGYDDQTGESMIWDLYHMQNTSNMKVELDFTYSNSEEFNELFPVMDSFNIKQL